MNHSEALMQEAAEMLDRHFNGSTDGKDRRNGFVLIAFPLGVENTDAGYVTNCGQTVMVIEKLLARLRRNIQ